MSDPVFLVETLPAVGPSRLGGREGRHAARVRRLRAGESLVLSDGAGGLARCLITAVVGDTVDLEVSEVEHQSAPEPRVVVVQALPKGERAELAVELLTEVGVDEIVPWGAARCVTRWRDDRAGNALARWRSTAREAAKQSRRAFTPVVAELATTVEVARRLAAADRAFVLHESAVTRLATRPVPPSGEIVLVVGPEGGVTVEEIAAFGAAGAVVVQLGDTVLRTSTAGCVAAALVLSRTRWR